MNQPATSPCEHLAFLFAYELRQGNHVAEIIDFRDASGHLRMHFAEPLKIWGTPATGEIGDSVRYWDSLVELGLTVDECELMENCPRIDSGFRCSVHGHIVVGPSKSI